jgi:hypothetical protein
VPIPNGEPCIAIKAPSPPLDPPTVSIVFHGFSVRPKIIISESAVCGSKPMDD